MFSLSKVETHACVGFNKSLPTPQNYVLMWELVKLEITPRLVPNHPLTHIVWNKARDPPYEARIDWVRHMYYTPILESAVLSPTFRASYILCRSATWCNHRVCLTSCAAVICCTVQFYFVLVYLMNGPLKFLITDSFILQADWNYFMYGLHSLHTCVCVTVCVICVCILNLMS